MAKTFDDDREYHIPDDDASTPPADASDPTGELSAADAQNQLTAVQSELDEMKDRLLRVSADYQNYTRRTQQNLAEARRQQLTDVVKALLGVLDHFDRALGVDPDKVTAQSLLQGVQIVRDELAKTLEHFGIQKIDVKPGEPFDPARHEALMHQPAPGIAPNHVAAQLQPGYTLGDRTLRPAKVSVASA